VFSAGVIFSWALANQPDNNSVEIKQNELVTNELETSCSMGLLVGGNIGHKIRTKVTESLKEIGKKCDALKTKLKEEKRKLSEIQGKTRADEIKRIIGNRSGDGVEKLNFDSRKLAKEIKSLIERMSEEYLEFSKQFAQ
ncbi:14222_t:CDS:2, partial [Racocetra persica]